MAKILFGLILSSVGSALVIAGINSRIGEPIAAFFIGLTMALGGLVLLLNGIKYFFIQEIIDELKKRNTVDLPKPKDPFTPDK